MTDDVNWLVQEISDLLDAGQAGLYEFVWTLRQRYPGKATRDLAPICRPALDELLRDPAVRLGWYIWPSLEMVRLASEADLTPSAFDDIGTDPYLGIERIEQRG